MLNEFLIELSGAKPERGGGLINALIRLARKVYLSQSENGAMPYNEIYGCHRRGLRPWLSTVCKDGREKEDSNPALVLCNNYYRISIRLSFASPYTGRREIQTTL
jgi:hypothetical protein